MFSDTHKLIAGKVYTEIESEFNLRVDLKSLLKGSIAPDRMISMIFKSHCKNRSIAIVHNNIDRLLGTRLDTVNMREMADFSLTLGIIIHFLSDYFCKAHNERKYSNLIRHFIYEIKLESFLKKYKLVKLINSTNSKKGRIFKGSVKAYVDRKHQEYISLRRSMRDDICYAVEVSTMVALQIIRHCLAGKLEEQTA